MERSGLNRGVSVRIDESVEQKDAKKLFFFYSFEAPQVAKPGPIRLYRMPTALERQGDFSQTFDANGRLIFIKDPRSTGPRSGTSARPACFSRHIIPGNRREPN